MAENEQVQATTTTTAPQVTPVVTEPTQPVTATTEQAPKPESTMTLEAALKELKEVRAEAAKYRTGAKAAEKAKADADEAALKEQGKFKELYVKAQKELQAKADELAKRDKQDLQRKVAARVGLPDKLALKISGETEAEMEVDAKEMRSAIPGQVLGNDAKPGSKGNGTSEVDSITGMTKAQRAQWTGVDEKFIR